MFLFCFKIKQSGVINCTAADLPIKHERILQYITRVCLIQFIPTTRLRWGIPSKHILICHAWVIYLLYRIFHLRGVFSSLGAEIRRVFCAVDAYRCCLVLLMSDSSFGQNAVLAFITIITSDKLKWFPLATLGYVSVQPPAWTVKSELSVTGSIRVWSGTETDLYVCRI
jgi:hypothetical protein